MQVQYDVSNETCVVRRVSSVAPCGDSRGSLVKDEAPQDEACYVKRAETHSLWLTAVILAVTVKVALTFSSCRTMYCVNCIVEGYHMSLRVLFHQKEWLHQCKLHVQYADYSVQSKAVQRQCPHHCFSMSGSCT